MSAYRKNFLVGLTVLASLAALGWMVLQFGDAPARLFARPQIPILIRTPRAEGLASGSAIQFRGVTVGKVSSLRFSDDRSEVLINANVDREPPLPGNVQAIIRSPSVLGSGSIISLDVQGPFQGQLEAGQELIGRFAGGLASMLPPEFAELATDLRQTSQQIRESHLVPDIDRAVKAAEIQIIKLGEVLDSVQGLVGDEKLRGDLRQAIANFRATAENTNRASGKLDKIAADATTTLAEARVTLGKAGTQIDALGTQIGQRLAQASTLLESLDAIARKINAGEGTAGKVVNDPKLYQSLVASAAELQLAIKDLRRLVQQWEQEGVYFKLSK